MNPFGDAPVRVSPIGRGWSAQAEMDLVRDRLANLSPDGAGELFVFEAPRTAAFSRRDSLLAGYSRAARAAAEAGFAPVTRPVGGHLAIYDEGSLVLHLCAPHRDPRAHIQERFVAVGTAIVEALQGFGVDARVGPVPGEYCDGAYSVNRGGVAKLAGTGQRITGRGYLFSAVVMVRSSALIARALTEAYGHLGLELDPGTVGAVSDSAPLVTLDEVRLRLLKALAGVLPLHLAAVPAADPVGGSVRSAVSGL